MSQPRAHQVVGGSYDAVAGEYAARFRGELDHKPLDRALLSALLEQSETGTAIADVGCGPGHVSGWLAGHGRAVVGIDLSPAMVDLAEAEHPDVEFRHGDLLALPAAEGEFGAAVAFYSIIHLEPGELVPALFELHRVLRPDGLFLVAFHIGSEAIHRDEWWGHEVDLTFHLLDPDEVSRALEEAGFELLARLERVSYPGEFETRRAYLLSRAVAVR